MLLPEQLITKLLPYYCGNETNMSSKLCMCHRLKIQDMELTRQFVCSCRKQSAGMPVGAQANWCDSPAHAQCFSDQMREADDHDVI